MTASVTVVGAGVAGLVCARRLALRGRRVTVWERASRPGGQVARQSIAGVQLDAAAESFAIRGNTVADLVTELGMADRICTPEPSQAWLVRSDGTGAPLPATGILGVPADPNAADLRALVGAAAAARAAQDAELPAEVGADAETLGELVRVRMGQPIVDELVLPVVRGVHSMHPDQLPLDAAAPGLRAALRREGSLAAAVGSLRASMPAGSAVAGLRGGMFGLVDALVADCERLGVAIHTGVSRAAQDVSGAVIRAAGESAQPRHVTVVTLVVECPELDAAPRGSGVLVADSPGTGDAGDLRARALTHLTAKWAWVAQLLPGQHALRVSYDQVPAQPERQAASDANILLGVRGMTVLDATVARWTRTGGMATNAPKYAVGEWVAGTGLAAVIGHAERTAAEYERMEP